MWNRKYCENYKPAVNSWRVKASFPLRQGISLLPVRTFPVLLLKMVVVVTLKHSTGELDRLAAQSRTANPMSTLG